LYEVIDKGLVGKDFQKRDLVQQGDAADTAKPQKLFQLLVDANHKILDRFLNPEPNVVTF
jgi:hypothetical protein